MGNVVIPLVHIVVAVDVVSLSKKVQHELNDMKQAQKRIQGKQERQVVMQAMICPGHRVKKNRYLPRVDAKSSQKDAVLLFLHCM